MEAYAKETKPMKHVTRAAALLLALLLLLSGCARGEAPAPEDSPSPAPETTAPSEPAPETTPETPAAPTFSEASEGCALKAYRMFPYFWLEDDAFAATEQGLLAYKDVIDEITLFCDNMSASYMTDATIAKWTAILKQRIAALKADGFASVGINMLQTTSHGSQPLSIANGDLPTPPMQTVVSYDGTQSAAQLCMSSEEFKTYIAKKYAAYAKCDPDFIWVDDDLRIADKPFGFGCFCDLCMARFNELYDTDYDRESLVERLNGSSDSPAVQELRRRWSSFVLANLNDTLAVIRDAVHAVSPDIKLGLMTVHLPAQEYVLSDYTGLLETLGAEKVRPGGGFHNEAQPSVLLDKIMATAHQNDQVGFIDDDQYEFENWPQTYDKSTKIQITESTLAIMSGCSGIAFASMPPDQGNDEMMEAIRTMERTWDEMVYLAGDWELYGACALYDNEYGVYSRSYYLSPNAALGFYNQENTFAREGFVPPAAKVENSTVTLITEDLANGLSDAEIRDIFSRGVFLDGGAANALARKGYGDLVGMTNAAYKTRNVCELYTDHALNGSAAGTCRYMYAGGYWTYLRLLEGAEPLAVAASAQDFSPLKDVTAYVYENSLGGRVAVFGCLPWSYSGTWQHTLLLNNVFEWLSRGEMACRVMNDTQIFQLFKKNDAGDRFMLMLVPSSLDDSVDDLQVRLFGEFTGTFYAYDDAGNKTILPADAVAAAGGYTTLTLPAIESWRFTVIVNEP